MQECLEAFPESSGIFHAKTKQKKKSYPNASVHRMNIEHHSKPVVSMHLTMCKYVNEGSFLIYAVIT